MTTQPLLRVALPLFPLGTVLFPRPGCCRCASSRSRYRHDRRCHRNGCPSASSPDAGLGGPPAPSAEDRAFAEVGTLAAIRRVRCAASRPAADRMRGHADASGCARANCRSTASGPPKSTPVPDDLPLAAADDLKHTADALRRLVDTLEERRRMEGRDGVRLPIGEPYRFEDCGWVAEPLVRTAADENRAQAEADGARQPPDAPRTRQRPPRAGRHPEVAAPRAPLGRVAAPPRWPRPPGAARPPWPPPPPSLQGAAPRGGRAGRLAAAAPTGPCMRSPAPMSDHLMPPFRSRARPRPPHPAPRRRTTTSSSPNAARSSRRCAARRRKARAWPSRTTSSPATARRRCVAAHGETEAEELEATPIEVSVAGRMMLKRVMGKASFATLQDATGRIQLFITSGRHRRGGLRRLQALGPRRHPRRRGHADQDQDRRAVGQASRSCAC